MIGRSLLSAVCVAALVSVSPMASSQAPSVDDLVARNTQAKGGAAALNGVQSVKQTASMSMQGMQATMTMLAKRPAMVRQEMNVGGQQIVTAFDGTTAWTISPMTGGAAQPMTGPEAAILKDQSPFDGPLMNYKARGSKVEFVGTETVAGKSMHHLRVTPTSGLVTEVYLDAATYLEARVVVSSPMGEMTQDLSDYRDVSGMKVPFAIQMLMGGAPVAEIRVQSVEFNTPIADALFKMGGK